MIGHLVFKIEAAEPAVGQVKLDLLAQLALEADAVAVADDKHPQHELGIDRRPADLAVEGLQLLAKLTQHARYDWIDAPQEVAVRVISTTRSITSDLSAALPAGRVASCNRP